MALAVVGGGAWYVGKDNAESDGGKSEAESLQAAQAQVEKKYDLPQVGDCVRFLDSSEDAMTATVDCASAEAEYKTSERYTGANAKCRSHFDNSFHLVADRGVDVTVCFTKV
ncbi:hypothetical protein [Streptomyces sp. XD-27]|uniref:LppU/SCO3897 family protein n=1 Tax=Streptomyces sp. XD-27 TaxID=3062779 RepID=UPI0026F45986|nr:hypothetical protein [Streptomyces sp. XD-27]WKX71613.1 hypothetical protein Q3Y56_18320 [Streptomyces sp. XD-27]